MFGGKSMASNHKRVRFVGIWILILAIATSFGCAGISYTKADANTNGIRYYRPATYFLVTPDYETNSAHVESIELPDTSTTYAMDPYAWFAKNNTNIVFSKGMLSKIESDADSTKLPQTVIEAATAVAKETLTQLAKQAELAAKLKGGGPGLLAPAERAKVEKPQVFLFMATAEGIVQVYPPKK
jgi:hypothetical protein